MRSRCKLGLDESCLLREATVVSLTPLCGGEHESKSFLSIWSLKMMLKSEQAEGMHEDTQGHFFRWSVSQERVFWGAPVSTTVPETHLIWIFQANMLASEILHFSWAVKNTADVSTLRTTGLQGILVKDGGLTGKKHWVCARPSSAGVAETNGLSTWLSICYCTPGIHTRAGNMGPYSHETYTVGKHTSGSNPRDVEMSDWRCGDVRWE